MAETATTRPARARKATSEKDAKAAPAKKAAASAGGVQVGEDGRTRVPVQLEHKGDTARYSKFAAPESSGCVGTLYAPLGTEEVKVLLIGPTK